MNTLEKLSKFNTPVEIHSIDEIQPLFYCKKLINKLLKDKLFGYASNIIRKEILYLFGGVYNDIGLKQESPINHILKTSKHLFYINERGFIDVCLMGLEKNSDFMKRELDFIKNLSRIDSIHHLDRTPQYPQGWTTTASMQTTLLSKEWEDICFVFQNKEFTYHGMRLWNTSPQYRILQENPNYFFED